MKSNPKPSSQSSLKVIAGGKPALVAGGPAPDDDMTPGRYVAKAHLAQFVERGGRTMAVIVYEIAEGQHAGAVVRQWMTVRAISGEVMAGTKYYNHCEMALGRKIERGDNLDPEHVFVDKFFVVQVGYRLNGADRTFSPTNAATKKGERDFLRVHTILEAL